MHQESVMLLTVHADALFESAKAGLDFSKCILIESQYLQVVQPLRKMRDRRIPASLPSSTSLLSSMPKSTLKYPPDSA